MLKNSRTAMWKFKIFQGEKPPDPTPQGRPRLTRPGRAASNAGEGEGEGTGPIGSASAPHVQNPGAGLM